MEKANNMKALYIVVNAGFADDVADLARTAGAKGGTIINARGAGAVHKTILGITVDTEKELLFIIADVDTAEKIMASIKEKFGASSPANSICFVMPVEKMIGICEREPGAQKDK